MFEWAKHSAQIDSNNNVCYGAARNGVLSKWGKHTLRKWDREFIGDSVHSLVKTRSNIFVFVSLTHLRQAFKPCTFYVIAKNTKTSRLQCAILNTVFLFSFLLFFLHSHTFANFTLEHIIQNSKHKTLYSHKRTIRLGERRVREWERAYIKNKQNHPQL